VPDRGGRLAAKLGERELDAMLVTHLVNVRYLTGFGGTNGACICTGDERIFLTDFRYTERAEAEVDGWEVVTVEGDWLKGIAERLRGRVGFEDDHLSVRLMSKLREQVGEGSELIAAGGAVEDLRRVKEPHELEAIEAAAQLTDAVYEATIAEGLKGRTEDEVARAAVARIRAEGAEPSFPPIVAAGPNGALPHAEPSDREIGDRELLIFDMGAELDGYCSDCTRTYATGTISDEDRAVYELVLRAQEKALEAIRAGKSGRDVDVVARNVIEKGGHGDRFGHGLGHGVGLEVHESPRLSSRSEDTLRSGEVVTVEPGIYLPGRLGVRIEDLVVVEEDGLRNLSGLPKELTVVE
jgi:Xaa-Pro aminopeptidase